jgi:hypothetical protein
MTSRRAHGDLDVILAPSDAEKTIGRSFLKVASILLGDARGWCDSHAIFWGA